MFLSRNKRRLIQHIENLAEKYDYSLTELNPGGNDNIICLQPQDKVSQVGPDKEMVTGFNLLVRSLTPARLKQGVTFNTKSKMSGVHPDYAESEPDFATPTEIYYIELRFS